MYFCWKHKPKQFWRLSAPNVASKTPLGHRHCKDGILHKCRASVWESNFPNKLDHPTSDMDLGFCRELYLPSEGVERKVSRLQWKAQGPSEAPLLSRLHGTSSLPGVSRASRPDLCEPHIVLAVSVMAFTLSGGSLCGFSAHPSVGLFLPPTLKMMKVSHCSRVAFLANTKLTWCHPSPERMWFGSWFYSSGWKKQPVRAFVGKHLWECTL